MESKMSLTFDQILQHFQCPICYSKQYKFENGAYIDQGIIYEREGMYCAREINTITNKYTVMYSQKVKELMYDYAGESKVYLPKNPSPPPDSLTINCICNKYSVVYTWKDYDAGRIVKDYVLLTNPLEIKNIRKMLTVYKYNDYQVHEECYTGQTVLYAKQDNKYEKQLRINGHFDVMKLGIEKVIEKLKIYRLFA